MTQQFIRYVVGVFLKLSSVKKGFYERYPQILIFGNDEKRSLKRGEACRQGFDPCEHE